MTLLTGESPSPTALATEFAASLAELKPKASAAAFAARPTTLVAGSPGSEAAALARLMIDVGTAKAGENKLSAAKPRPLTA